MRPPEDPSVVASALNGRDNYDPTREFRNRLRGFGMSRLRIRLIWMY
jgi:hypothetical protein